MCTFPSLSRAHVVSTLIAGVRNAGRALSSDKQTPPQGQGHQSDSPPPWPSGGSRGCSLPSPEVGGEMEKARILVQLFSSPRKGEASGEASAWDGGSRDMSPPGMSSPAPGEWILPGATPASSRVTPGLSNFPQDHVHLYLFHRWPLGHPNTTTTKSLPLPAALVPPRSRPPSGPPASCSK